MDDVQRSRWVSGAGFGPLMTESQLNWLYHCFVRDHGLEEEFKDLLFRCARPQVRFDEEEELG